jgi:DNA-binding transcriptional LysR family regulator
LHQDAGISWQQMLNLDQIHIFLLVAKHLHFSRAAEELYITQPAVSATIAKLETQLGFSLFHRIGRRVELTDAGRFLQQEGQLLLEQSKQLERGLQDFNALQRGSLQLGASFTVGNYWLPRHLARFRKSHPAIELHCRLANAETILDGIDSGQFDLGFLCGRQPNGAVKVVGEERLILVVGRHHPWFGKAPIEHLQLLDADWLMREPGSGARHMLELSLQQIGLSVAELSILQVLHSSEMVKALVCCGHGLAALPASMVELEIELGVLWPVTLSKHVLPSEPIWMVRSPQRQESLLLNAFESLLCSG